MAYLDFMAYARGGEAGRARAEREATFNLQFPIAQLGAEEAYGRQLGARAGAEFQTGVLSEMSRLPVEERNAFLADSVQRRIQNLATTPGGAQELDSIRNFAALQAQRLVQQGDIAGAQRLYSSVPGAESEANRLGEIQKWSNPQTAFDEMNLATGAAQMGGRYDPQTKKVLMPNGVQLDQTQFAQYMRRVAESPLADRTPGMLARQENQIRLDEGDRIVELYRQNGWAATKDPITGQVTPRFQLQTGAPAQPQTAMQDPPVMPSPGVNMSYAPGMQLPVLSNQALGQLPGSTGPTLTMPVPAMAAPAAAPMPGSTGPTLTMPVPAMAAPAAAIPLDQARATRMGIEQALRTLNRQQPGVMSPSVQYYQQELVKAQQLEAQASAKADADALARYQATLQQQGYVPGRPFTPWLTQPGAQR